MSQFPARSKQRVAVLISGTGSNMLALVEAARADDYPAEIVCVLSNQPDAKGLVRAKDLGLEAIAIDHRPFKGDRARHEQAITAALRQHQVEWIAMAGYMRLVTHGFIETWQGRLVNIHPSLLPKYPGLNTHKRALDAGDREAGCTVHHVIAEVDAGPIIGQARVPILAGDTADSLAARVLEAEHKLYPECLAKALRGERAT